MVEIGKILLVFLLVANTQIDFSISSRILAIFPVPLRDHQVIFRPLIENLIERGHNLTIVTTDPHNFETRNDNVEIIDLSFAHRLPVLNMLKNGDNMLSGSEMLRTVFHVMRTVAEAELKSAQIQPLLALSDGLNIGHESERFDAVIVDWSGPILMNAFAAKFKAPLIGITPGGAYSTAHQAIGNPNHPVAFPSILMPFSEDLNLFQRIASTIFTLKYSYLYFNEELPKQDEIVKTYFGNDLPELKEIESNADLLFINSYQSLGNSRPIGPTTIYLGGIHAKKLNALPWHLESFIENSNGIVYINLGEPVTKAFLQTYRMEKLMKILEKSSFDVVLNLNGIEQIDFNTTAKLYQGVHLPQEEILAHTNVKLFVTLGGQRDIEDAIKHKTPILGFTFSSNLEHYLLQIVKNDAGIISNIDLDSSADLLGKIEAFAITERYQRNIDKLHKIVNDQPQTSIERGVWWIEYVIRNNGTQHLRNSWNKLSWFQYLLFDVILAIVVMATMTIIACAMIIIRIRRYSKSLPFEKVTRRTKAKML